MISREANEANRTFDKQAFQKLGGVDGLLGRSLKRSLDTILSKAERERALGVLLALTDLERNVRAGQFSVAQLKKMPGKVHGNLSEVEAAVLWLMEARLITPVAQEGNMAYELAHERLISALRKVANQELSAVNRANMLLDSRVNEWLGSGTNRRYLFGLGELWLLRQQRGFLEWGQRESQKRELLRRSWVRGRANLGLLGMPIALGVLFGVWSYTPPGQIQWARWDLAIIVRLGMLMSYRVTPSSDPSDLSTALNLDMVSGMKNNLFPDVWLTWFAVERYNVAGLSEVIRLAEENKDRATGKKMLNQVYLVSRNIADPILLSRQAEGYGSFQDEVKAQQLLAEALKVTKLMEGEDAKAQAITVIAGVYSKLNDSGKAQQVLAEALEATKSMEGEYAKAQAITVIAGAYGKLNDSGKAQQVLAEALEATKSIKSELVKSKALSTIAEAYSKLNNSSKDQQVLAEALRVTKSIKEESSKSNALSTIAEAYSKLNNSSKAQQVLAEALEATKSIKSESAKFQTLSEIAKAYSKSNNSSKAQQVLAEALEATKSIKSESAKFNPLISIAGAYGKLNDGSKAQQVLSKALEVTKSFEEHHKPDAIREIVEASSKLNDSSKTQQVLSDVLEVSKSMKEERYKSEVIREIVEASSKLNDSSKVQKAISDVLEVTKSMKGKSSKSMVLSEIAGAYVKIGDKTKATDVLNEATKNAELSQRSEPIKEAAQIHAELGNWGEALRLSHRCNGDDRLIILARILRVHAEQQNPEFKVLREGKPDEAEE
jgi:tetratricopeptide (TPR) repeat protein